MNNFEVKQIQEIANFNPSEKLPKGTIAKSVPMGMLKEFQRKITGYEISDFKSGAKFRNGDVLVAKITPCLENGKTALVDILETNEVAFGSTEFIVLRAKPETNAEFLYYFARSPAFRKKAIGCMEGTSGRQRVNENALKSLELPIPNTVIQEKIARVLSALDRKIALNNQINEQLEQMAKTLYDYWFVQFDFPDDNGKPYKSSGGKMVYNDNLKREIPNGWEVGKIKDYCPSIGGFAFKSDEWTTQGNPVIKIKNIQENFTLDTQSIDFVNLDNTKVDKKFKGKAGNIVIAMTGATIGKFAIIPKNNTDFYINQRVGYFNLGENPVERLPFLINSIQLDYFREAIFSLSGGAAQPNISNEQINNIALIKPTKDLLCKFNQILQSSYEKILLNQYSNIQLTQLRDWLLPMLMNGQITVN